MEKINNEDDFTKCGNKMEFKLKKENFIFVNEIVLSTKLKDISVPKASRVKTDLKREHGFEKYTTHKNNSNEPVEPYEKDSCGRKIKVCNGNLEDEFDYYVCNEKLVMPRYLIQFSSKLCYYT